MRKTFLFFLLGIMIFLSSCEGPEGKVGPSGLTSLLKTSEEPIGSNCEYGGLKVETGIDMNENGLLDDVEVLKSEYVCSVAGTSSLINVIDEPIGTICENGGIRIETGFDTNLNEILDEEEIQITRYICNGIDGTDGSVEPTINEIRFKLVSLGGTGTSNVTATPVPPWNTLIQFDKNSFPDMTSAILIAYIETSNTNTTCFVDLFDVDNNIAITGSEISTNSIDRVWIESENFLSNLPDSKSDLVLRTKSETEGIWVGAIQAYLILRKE